MCTCICIGLLSVDQPSLAQRKKAGLGAIFAAMVAKGAVGANGRPNAATMMAVLANMADQLNKQMPMTIDSETRLDNILASPTAPKFTYNYTLSISLKEIKETNLLDQVRPTLVKGVCTNPDMKIFIDNGVTVGYSYRAMDGSFAGKIEVSPAICG